MTRFEALDPEIRGVLGKKVSELGLRVEGSPVEGYVRQLYKELERRGLKKFRPVCYLTDEWGCPDQQPVLGIPFYLADPKLQTIEKAATTMIMLSRMNIITRSLFSAWKKAGKNSFQSRV